MRYPPYVGATMNVLTSNDPATNEHGVLYSWLLERTKKTHKRHTDALRAALEKWQEAHRAFARGVSPEEFNELMDKAAVATLRALK